MKGIYTYSSHHMGEGGEEFEVMWCKISCYASDIEKNKTWEKREAMIDVKLANAKTTMMQLMRDNLGKD